MKQIASTLTLVLICTNLALGTKKVIPINTLYITETSDPEQWLAFQRTVNYTQLLPNKQILNSDGLSNNYLNWFSVVVGGFHACAIRRYADSSTSRTGNGGMDYTKPIDAPGMLFCWGMNLYGQTDHIPPFGRPSDQCITQDLCWDLDDGWRNLSAGWLHTCGILADGRLYCWGNNRQNQVGDESVLIGGGLNCTGENNQDHCNAAIEGKWALTPFGGVAAGRQHTCAIRCTPTDTTSYRQDIWALTTQWGSVPSTCSHGEVVCWGDDNFNQSAQGLKMSGASKYSDFVSVCAAAAHSCAVRQGGQAICWGFNGNNRAKVPQEYSTLQWQSIKCKGAHTCALAKADSLGHSTLACWGHNAHNQTVVPQYQQKFLSPQNFSTVPSINILVYGRSYLAYDAGEYSTCALWQQTLSDMACDTVNSRPPSLNGECWGDGSYSQGALPSRRIGHQLKDICRILQWKYVSTGSYHSCGISIDDVGTSCQQEGTCDEYPSPVGKQPQGAITYCPRGTFGTSAQLKDINPALASSPDAKKVQPCVPIRINQMRCWGLESYSQLEIPGSAGIFSPTSTLILCAATVLSMILVSRQP